MMDRVLSWSFALALAAFLLFLSLQQLFGPSPNPVFGLIEARSGIAIFEPFVRWLVAALELVAAGLVVWPAMRMRGAQLALLVALGAIAFHLSPWLGWQVPNQEAVSAALRQGATAAQIQAMNLPTDNGAMFLLAIVIGMLAVVNILICRYAAAHPAVKAHNPATDVFAHGS